LQVWGIGSPGYKSETEDALRAFRDAFGLTFPILLDNDGSVMEAYSQDAFEVSPYPQDWVIGADGRVAYVNTAYEADEIRAIVEEELAK
jgi:peroxiredoxin